MRQRIQLSNAIRGHMAEFGLVAPIGREGLQTLIRLIVKAMDARAGRGADLPGVAGRPTAAGERTDPGEPIDGSGRAHGPPRSAAG